MSDIVDTGQAQAPAPSPERVPVNPDKGVPTKPLGNQAPTKPQDAQEPEPSQQRGAAKSVREAIERGRQRSAEAQAGKNGDGEPKSKQEAPAKPQDQPAKEPQPRDNGKFAARQQASDDDAPSRFSNEGKAAWKEAPEAVRRETQRALRELEDGIGKYRAGHEYSESLKEFEEAARKEGSSVKQTVEQYLNVRRALADPSPARKVEAIKEIIEFAGVNVRDYAAYVLGQSQDEQTSARDTEIRQLREVVGHLQQQLGGVSQNMQSSAERQMLADIEAFAQERPRFEELSQDIAKLLQTGYAATLPEAYEIADRLRPGQHLQQQPEPQSAPQPVPLNPAGQRSVSGAPVSGSDLTTRKGPPPSIREAMERARRTYS